MLFPSARFIFPAVRFGIFLTRDDAREIHLPSFVCAKMRNALYMCQMWAATRPRSTSVFFKCARRFRLARHVHTPKFASSRCLSVQNSLCRGEMYNDHLAAISNDSYSCSPHADSKVSRSRSASWIFDFCRRTMRADYSFWEMPSSKPEPPFFSHYRRFNHRERQSMRFPRVTSMYANFAIKAFSCVMPPQQRRPFGAESTATFVSLPIEMYIKKGERERGTLMLIVYRYAYLLGAPSEYAFRALRRRRINSAAGGFSVKPPQLLSSSRNFLLKDMHTPAAFTGN